MINWDLMRAVIDLKDQGICDMLVDFNVETEVYDVFKYYFEPNDNSMPWAYYWINPKSNHNSKDHLARGLALDFLELIWEEHDR